MSDVQKVGLNNTLIKINGIGTQVYLLFHICHNRLVTLFFAGSVERWASLKLCHSFHIEVRHWPANPTCRRLDVVKLVAFKKNVKCMLKLISFASPNLIGQVLFALWLKNINYFGDNIREATVNVWFGLHVGFNSCKQLLAQVRIKSCNPWSSRATDWRWLPIQSGCSYNMRKFRFDMNLRKTANRFHFLQLIQLLWPRTLN